MKRRFLAGVLALTAWAHPALACDGRSLTSEHVHASPLCVPEKPLRVVVMDFGFGLGIGLDVGLPIVGAPLDRMSDETLKARAIDAGVTTTGFITEPSLETIVALQPDLIVGFPGSEPLAQAIYPQLSQLAPTLLYTDADWREFYRLMASLTGAEDRVNVDLAAYQARLDDIRARVPQDKTVSILRITPWDFQVYLDGPVVYAPFAVLRDAGVRRTEYETTQDPAETVKRPDWEELAGLSGDTLLYIVGGTNDSATSGRHEEVLANPLWQMLPAVQSGNVHRIEAATWMEFSGLASANRVLDDVERYIIDPK